MTKNFINVVLSLPVAVIRCLESAAQVGAVLASEGRDCRSLSIIIVSQENALEPIWVTLHGVVISASATLATTSSAIIIEIVAEIILDVLAARPAFNIATEAIWKYAYKGAIIAQYVVIVALFYASSTVVRIHPKFAAEVARIFFSTYLDCDEECSQSEARESFLAIYLLHCFVIFFIKTVFNYDYHLRNLAYIHPENSSYFLSGSKKPENFIPTKNIESMIAKNDYK